MPYLAFTPIVLHAPAPRPASPPRPLPFAHQSPCLVSGRPSASPSPLALSPSQKSCLASTRPSTLLRPASPPPAPPHSFALPRLHPPLHTPSPCLASTRPSTLLRPASPPSTLHTPSHCLASTRPPQSTLLRPASPPPALHTPPPALPPAAARLSSGRDSHPSNVILIEFRATRRRLSGQSRPNFSGHHFKRPKPPAAPRPHRQIRQLGYENGYCISESSVMYGMRFRHPYSEGLEFLNSAPGQAEESAAGPDDARFSDAEQEVSSRLSAGL
ncbi:proline-rich receptor-like protein kinase PERK8 [Penaeus japonicus]|uniref:proline-rich receptor-like protein kinase PERK8 n=1 Tax=Penaeus japonicus TaxID=27405 RepID=UPI001C715F65|nr:proline-rich receptor-like protein kinase PERK8 [Penaeus japonicus]